jgi:hypothetical protein
MEDQNLCVCDKIFPPLLTNELLLRHFQITSSDILALHSPNFSIEDSALSESMLDDDGAYEVDEEITGLTILFCKTSVRHWAPSTRISLLRRLSVMRVYID